MVLVAAASASSSVPFFPVVALQPLAAISPSLGDYDPLEADDRADRPVLTTERRLRRLALVAADTGARFARERIGHDPVAWLLAPRALFDGRSALDACQGRSCFLRAVLLHGLSLGLDADPDEVDAINGEEGGGRAGSTPPVGEGAGLSSAPRFFVCSVDELDDLAGGAVVWLMPAEDEAAARLRLQERYGSAAERAVVREALAGPDGERDDFLSQLMAVLLVAAGGASAGVEFRLEIGRFA
jgi:hypothetical protein